MVFKNRFILVLWAKVAPEFEGFDEKSIIHETKGLFEYPNKAILDTST